MKRQTWTRKLFLYAIVIFWCVICLFPFYWLFTTSLKKPLHVSRGPRYIPYVDYEPTGEHWDYLFNEQREILFRHFRNSLIAASGSTLLAVVIGAMAGYGLARYAYHWRALGWRNDNIAFWIISQRFLPPALFVVPFLMLYARLNLVDTYLGLILAYTMFNIPFAVWIMRDFFENLPTDLEDSALVDGATHWQAFVRIVLPLSAPGLVSVAIFSFVFAWNEFLYALMLTNFDAITIPVLIAGQSNTRGIQWWFISALTLAAVTPVILIGLFLERYITRGLTAGALKG
ncbi:MAG: ABC transporter permease subunit [Gammaproteobacteria bacterium]|nr:ABC transporter permease subunit [Gammaproteobacteria bacterium]NIO62944.1 ABC transporter permease subunit [Gammaproteobacteria bacterium]